MNTEIAVSGKEERETSVALSRETEQILQALERGQHAQVTPMPQPGPEKPPR